MASNLGPPPHHVPITGAAGHTRGAGSAGRGAQSPQPPPRVHSPWRLHTEAWPVQQTRLLCEVVCLPDGPRGRASQMWAARLHICDPAPGLCVLRTSVSSPPHCPSPPRSDTFAACPKTAFPGAPGYALQASRRCTVAGNVLASAHRGRWAQTPPPEPGWFRLRASRLPCSAQQPPKTQGAPTPVRLGNPAGPQAPACVHRSGLQGGRVVEQDPGPGDPSLRANGAPLSTGGWGLSSCRLQGRTQAPRTLQP